jgi:hypothetical protein
MLLSMGIFFTMVILGLAGKLPGALSHGLTSAGLPAAQAAQIAHVPPTSALFAAFLGYNPIQTLVPAAALHSLSGAAQATLLGHSFFPSLVSPAFITGLRIAFSIGVVLSLLAAAASLVPAESRAARRAAAAARLEARETAEPPNPAAETGRRVAS